MAILDQVLETNEDDIVLKNIGQKHIRRFGCYGYISLVTAKLTIILHNMLWKSCSEYDYEQLFHSMLCKIMVSLAVASDNCCPWILVKWVIWFQNMHWEPCLEFNSEIWMQNVVIDFFAHYFCRITIGSISSYDW